MASNTFDFEYLPPHNELKGKSISIPFFRPVDPEVKLKLASKKVLKYDQFLMVHNNPLTLERNTDYTQKTKTKGFEETLSKISQDIVDYYTTTKSENIPLIFVIKGEVGSGKTALVRHLFDELHDV